jgi:hypothetical protein
MFPACIKNISLIITTGAFCVPKKTPKQACSCFEFLIKPEFLGKIQS